MTIILDASSAINLANGEVLKIVLRLKDRTFAIGPIVLKECGTHRIFIETLVDEGGISIIDDDDIPAATFLELLREHGLGDGETECLVVARSDNSIVVASDDAAARRTIVANLGPKRLSGSLGLLRKAVRQELLTVPQAIAAYEQMLARGGFLPIVDIDFFKN